LLISSDLLFSDLSLLAVMMKYFSSFSCIRISFALFDDGQLDVMFNVIVFQVSYIFAQGCFGVFFVLMFQGRFVVVVSGLNVVSHRPIYSLVLLLVVTVAL
jgi:hypothetical protein